MAYNPSRCFGFVQHRVKPAILLYRQALKLAMFELSVVIPTYNRLARLKRVLSALEQQDYPHNRFEVIVVSDASTDGTNEFLRSEPTSLHFQPLIQAHGGPAAARNNGVQHARGTIVLFIDDDVLPTPNLISQHLRFHQAENPDRIVLGPMLTPHDFAMTAWVRWEQAMLMRQYRAMINGDWLPSARQFYTGNTSLRRQHVIDCGGFDEHFRRAEDVEMAYRLAERGLTFVFNPDAIGYHYAERSFQSWLDIPYAYGRNDVIFARSRGQHWLLPTVQNEFAERNFLIRLLVHGCVGRPLISRGATASLCAAAKITDLLRLDRLTQVVYSSLFNLRYYQGFTDEHGDRSFLFMANSANITETSSISLD